MIKGSRVYAIVCCLFCAVPPMHFGTLVAVMDVMAAEDRMLPMTTLVTSLCRSWMSPMTDLSAGEFVLRVSRASANLFLCGVRRVPWTVLWDHHKTETVPDVLGLHARQPGAAAIKVLLGRDSRSGAGCKSAGPGMSHYWIWVTIADLSLLHLQCPVPVISGMARLQPELEQLRHVCKKRYRGTQTDMFPFVGRGLSWTCPDTSPAITWNSCLGVPYGRVRHKIVWTTYVWHM